MDDVPKQKLTSHALSHRREWSRQFLSLVAAIASSPLTATAQTEKSKVQLVVDDVSSLVHLPVLLAQHLGYFKNEGLLVDIVEQVGSPNESNLSAGVTAWSVPFEQILRANQKEITWTSLVQTGRTPQLALGINKKVMPVVKGLKDLEHKKIGVQELDSFSQYCSDYMLLQAGISLSRITYVPLGQSANAILSMRAGHVDAICFSDPLISLLDKKGEINVVRNLRSTRDTNRVFSGLVPGHSLCVPAQLVAKQPRTCQALVNGVLRAVKWLRTAGPSDLLHNMTDNSFLSDRAIYLHAVDNMRDSFTVDGILIPESIANALRLQRTLDPKISMPRNFAAASHTNEFVFKAKKKFNI
jgi:NitT/TauT family transport system substrate-binding protein